MTKAKLNIKKQLIDKLYLPSAIVDTSVDYCNVRILIRYKQQPKIISA